MKSTLVLLVLLALSCTASSKQTSWKTLKPKISVQRNSYKDQIASIKETLGGIQPRIENLAEKVSKNNLER